MLLDRKLEVAHADAVVCVDIAWEKVFVHEPGHEVILDFGTPNRIGECVEAVDDQRVECDDSGQGQLFRSIFIYFCIVIVGQEVDMYGKMS